MVLEAAIDILLPFVTRLVYKFRPSNCEDEMRAILGLGCLLALAACAERQPFDYMADLRARNDAAIAAQDYRIAHPDISPERLENDRLRAEDIDWQIARYKKQGIRLSDVSECNSQANAAFTDLAVKYIIRDQCLNSHRLRRQGR